MKRSNVVLAGVACVLLAMVPAASGNVLVNSGFETTHEDSGPRPTGWGYWDNVYSVDDTDNGAAHNGLRKLKMFGNWGWEWNAAGVVQEFPTSEGEIWSLDAYAMNSSVDPITGTQNHIVLKMEWYDAGATRLCGAEWEGYPPGLGCPEAVILNGSSPEDVWIDADPLVATAMPGTASVKALVLFLQPAYENGAGNVDDVTFRNVTNVPTVSTWGLVVLALAGLTLIGVVFGRRRGAQPA